VLGATVSVATNVAKVAGKLVGLLEDPYPNAIPADGKLYINQ
jgi:hypothetical protein